MMSMPPFWYVSIIIGHFNSFHSIHLDARAKRKNNHTQHAQCEIHVLQPISVRAAYEIPTLDSMIMPIISFQTPFMAQILLDHQRTYEKLV
jgi:hypothetical protein